VKEAIQDVRSPDGRVMKSADHVAVLLEELPSSNRKLQSVLNAAQNSLARLDATVEHADKAVSAISSKAEAALDSAASVASQFATATPVILRNVDTAAAAMARFAEGGARLTDDASKRVPLLLEGGDSVMRDAGEMISGARNAWPLRTWMTPPAVTTLNIDSDPR
jgi:ABC-type transporter Mla subunit MlaD